MNDEPTQDASGPGDTTPDGTPVGEGARRSAYQARRAELLRLLERHLSDVDDNTTLADQAFVSRAHFQRVFRQTVGEAPAELARRLRMERAAHDLRETASDVTGIALDAGYGSLEGFSRAFRRAYGVAPSRFREAVVAPSLLPGSSGVHYDSWTRSLRVADAKGEQEMDLTDRLIENDYWAKKQLLTAALTLSDAQLDARLAFRHNLMPFAEPARTLREELGRLTGDGWAVELLTTVGWPTTDDTYRVHRKPHSVSDMIARLDSFHRDWSAFVQKVKLEGLWETEWVDAACEPVETFTYGGTIELTLTWGIAERMAVQRLIEQIGLKPEALEFRVVQGVSG